jgi:hypothetical protein
MIASPKIGSIVKVTTRYPNSYYFSKEKYMYVVTAGQVVANDRLTPSDSFSITTGRKEFPIAIIANRNVIKIELPGKTLTQQIKKTAAKTWKVKSARSGEVYTVTNNNNAWSCTCVGFQYHRRCKHIVAKRGK